MECMWHTDLSANNQTEAGGKDAVTNFHLIFLQVLSDSTFSVWIQPLQVI